MKRILILPMVLTPSGKQCFPPWVLVPKQKSFHTPGTQKDLTSQHSEPHLGVATLAYPERVPDQGRESWGGPAPLIQAQSEEHLRDLKAQLSETKSAKDISVPISSQRLNPNAHWGRTFHNHPLATMASLPQEPSGSHFGFPWGPGRSTSYPLCSHLC